MSTIVETLVEELNGDIVSHGWLMQCIEQQANGGTSGRQGLCDTLAELLKSGNVQIGNARRASTDYVEFVAWHGSVEAKIQRAIKVIDSANDRDRDIAFWLCLSENVDRFEEV